MLDLLLLFTRISIVNVEKHRQQNVFFSVPKEFMRLIISNVNALLYDPLAYINQNDYFNLNLRIIFF